MKILLDSNAYSHLKRGHHRIADIVRNCEAILLPAGGGRRIALRLQVRLAHREEYPRAPRISRIPSRFGRGHEPRHGGPLRAHCLGATGQGAAHSDERHLGRRARHGDGGGSGFIRPALRITSTDLRGYIFPPRCLEPCRSLQLSQVSESGFLREGTRLRQVGGARQARAMRERRACLVGLRRSLARNSSLATARRRVWPVAPSAPDDTKSPGQDARTSAWRLRPAESLMVPSAVRSSRLTVPVSSRNRSSLTRAPPPRMSRRASLLLFERPASRRSS